ncbi:M15 family metallopeptidase [Aeromicrobium sp. CF4.19]|uniref:M15 family metallopeptidase n=1 Tax=Aeromicrobium sp. CF4.19 TaxID=3373082 RepID=UPI003EE5F3A6
MRRLLLTLATTTLVVAIASCTPDDGRVVAPSGDAAALSSARLEPVTAQSRVRAVPSDQWDAMVRAGMVREECPVQDRDQLRRVDLNFTDFDGQDHRGHLVVNADTAESVRHVFDQLYERAFPIARMVGVEEFDGDVGASLAANNTSAYNCRRSDQINAPFGESPHANGRAVDINPVQNPWVDLRCDCWTPSADNKERTPGAGKIVADDAVVRLFEAQGWVWQNIDVPDYMHFDTGYPSEPPPPVRQES